MFLNKYVLSEQTFRDQLEYIKIHFNVFFFLLQQRTCLLESGYALLACYT